MTFRIVPVIDLRHGLVVRARAGEREAYAPIRTPLASGSMPAEIARGLIAAVRADSLYVADLDAIMDGRPPDLAALHAIRVACPGVVLWVDAGFTDRGGIEHFLAGGLGRPVLGSETLRDPGLPSAYRSRTILSLDSRGGERLGLRALHEDPGLWPDTVVVMTLARVGGEAGPDLDAIARAIAARPSARVFAAGGVRDPKDITALRAIGAAGALVASAIHDGRLVAARID